MTESSSVRSILKMTGRRAVVATANRHSGFSDPVTVIKQIVHSVRQGEYILINRFPSLIAKAFRFRVVRIEYLSFFQHRHLPNPSAPYSRASSSSKPHFKTVILHFFKFPASFFLRFYSPCDFPAKILIKSIISRDQSRKSAPPLHTESLLFREASPRARR